MPYDIKLKPNSEPYNVKTFPVPRIHELTFKQDFDRIEALKVVKKVNRSQLSALKFLLPNKKRTVHPKKPSKRVED